MEAFVDIVRLPVVGGLRGKLCNLLNKKDWLILRWLIPNTQETYSSGEKLDVYPSLESFPLLFLLSLELGFLFLSFWIALSLFLPEPA